MADADRASSIHLTHLPWRETPAPDEQPTIITNALAAPFRACLELACSWRGWNVALRTDPQDLVWAATQPTPGCLLLDTSVDAGAMNLVRRVGNAFSAKPVICLSAAPTVDMAVTMMKRGAFDLLALPTTPDALGATIARAVASHRLTIKARLDALEVERRLANLSERERQVLDGMIHGQANKQIAYHLGLSQRTVETYRKRVMDKMEAQTPADLCRTLGLRHRCIFLHDEDDPSAASPGRCCHQKTARCHHRAEAA